MPKPAEKLLYDGSGRVVMDATHPMTITLKDEDGKTAVRCDPGHCLFAEAAKREFPGLVAVKFTRYFTRLCWPDHIVRYANSAAMRRLIASFDANGTFTPGVYTLLPPSADRRLGVVRSNKPRNTKKQEVPTRKPRVLSTTDLRPSTWSFGSTQPVRKRKPATTK